MAYRFHYAITMIVLSVVACRTVNTIEPAERRAQPRVIRDARVITDPSLGRKAAVLELRETTVGNGLLKIQAEILNTTNSRKEFNYRFDWIDDEGMVIDTLLSNWKRMSLAGQESSFVSAVAPTQRAVDFRLKLIEASK